MSKLCGSLNNGPLYATPGVGVHNGVGQRLVGLHLPVTDVVSGIPEHPHSACGSIGAFGQLILLFPDYTWTSTTGDNGQWGLSST